MITLLIAQDYLHAKTRVKAKVMARLFGCVIISIDLHGQQHCGHFHCLNYYVDVWALSYHTIWTCFCYILSCLFISSWLSTSTMEQCARWRVVSSQPRSHDHCCPNDTVSPSNTHLRFHIRMCAHQLTCTRAWSQSSQWSNSLKSNEKCVRP